MVLLVRICRTCHAEAVAMKNHPIEDAADPAATRARNTSGAA